MSFVYSLILTLIVCIWAYGYMKTYQLCGYDPLKFWDKAIEFKLAYGDKNRIKFTKRMIRFIVLFTLLIYFLGVIIIEFSSHWALILLDSVVMFIFTPIEIIVVHYLLLPFELGIKKYYMGKAAKKLATKSCIRIGITGSFGKTSTKNILAEILGKEYKVCVTPQSYNTEMGLTKTILQQLDDEDVLIAEMGARHPGDIEVLTKLIKPMYAIITTIGEQHIETFGSLEAIEKTKGELLVYMQSDGKAVISGDSPSGKKLYEGCATKKYLTCDPKGYAYAKNIESTQKGSRFTLVIDGRELVLKTRLLGRCNINNIVNAAALGSIMGISDKDIISAVASLEPTPHRLQLIKAQQGMTIIDDSYNSNLVGAQEALNVLNLFEGRKIVITPGIVELGSEQSSINFKLGAAIADAADYVIIMNGTNRNELLSGLISHNFNRENIFFAMTREQQKEVLKKLTVEGSVILFENDLPDNFR